MKALIKRTWCEHRRLMIALPAAAGVLGWAAGLVWTVAPHHLH